MNDKLPLIIANLKANKTWDEIVVWLDNVGKVAQNFSGTIIICPAHPFLSSTYQKIKSDNLKIQLGSQDISRFEQGPYTGEVAASLIANICAYAIIGHSERRQNAGEDDEMLAKKAQNAKAAKIEPVFCVQGQETPIPDGVTIIAYEPVAAIGTGNPDTPENARSVAKKLKEKSDYVVLYGGSISGKNVRSFLEKDILDGVLVGSASLDPREFIEIIESAQ
ncbi:triosephosphate isomerase [Candidatus Curtissbacteria bacterium]|nr:triosephosphate isomerase [Candidatus Curtissbacteria bacterium]